MNEHEFTSIVSALQSQQDLLQWQMRQTMEWLLSGEADESQMLQILELLSDKGESVAELAGAAQALRHSMRRVKTRHSTLVDTCGTGGDGTKTFNISTAAGIVAAAAGVAVAKHGNRKVTSRTGSADVLAELGIDLAASPELVEHCLEQLGICFCFAPNFHPAMRHVGPVRQRIARPTIFNRLGPLANPAGANCQVLGVGAADLQEKMALALQKLGTLRSLVVRGEDGVDEISLSAPTRILEVTSDTISEHQWQPEDFGLRPAERSELYADDPASSAACIRSVLAGEPGPKRDVVVMNAAAALWVAGVSKDLMKCVADVTGAIDSGRASQLVQQLGDMTAQDSSSS